MFIRQPQEVLIDSGLIAPRAHRESVFNLSEQEKKAMFKLLKLAKEYLDGKYAPIGYNIDWNIKIVGGQEVFHVHLHLIPRYEEEPLAGKGFRH